METDIRHMTREQIAEFLPAAIRKAAASYHEFAGRAIPAGADDKAAAKSFAEHHAACKAAITHIELLLKLARSAGMEDGADGEEAAALMRAAQEDLADFSGDYMEA
jgi:hypothetical protein